jgi:DNA-binding transcriptional regulator YhcF (GntR family)
MAIPFPSNSPGPSSRPKVDAESDASLIDGLRDRLMSDLHMGNLQAGDRLPSIRQVARDSGVDHRAVARAYRSLEKEGLVEIRGRSGVRVAHGLAPEPDARKQPASENGWLAEVLAESWLRSVPLSDLRRKLEARADASGLRCACVESNRDQMLAYCTEIGELSEMRMVPVYVDPGGTDAAELARLRRVLGEVDLVVTTQYHAATARAALNGGEPPLVVLRINPELADAVRRRLRGPGMTVVAATAEFGDRLRLMYGDVIQRDDQLRLVLAADAAAVRRLDPAEPVLLTRAAREVLSDDLCFRPLVFPHSPTIAPESVLELAEQIVGLNTAPSPSASA